MAEWLWRAGVRRSLRARPAREAFKFRTKMPGWNFILGNRIFVIGSVFT